MMQERHENEQYFFDQKAVDAVADLLEPFERPCVLCAPMVGVELEDRGTDVVMLDIDERFASHRSFRRWDLYRPERLEQRFGVVFCDPPFFNVSLSQLFHALRVLAHFDFGQPIAISYLSRRRNALLSTFAPFGVQETTDRLRYRTVKECRKNEIVLFANFPIRGTAS
ncbi:MAG: protein-lysine N-methyltransferase [Phycisphaerales bacterium]|nr:protein-lysine N-methyltransferase [Phycisphaerales bacterium]